jgi:hypothetical protein
MAMRKLSAAGFLCLALAFVFDPWTGPIGVGRAFAQQEPVQPVPAPQLVPMPPEHEKACDNRAFPERGELDRGCAARRDECPCVAAGCRPSEPDRCGPPCGGCRPMPERAWDDPCRRPARGDGHAEAADVLPPKGPLPLAAFALYAERSLRLGRCDAVEGGGLAVRAPAKDDDKVQLRIGAGGWIDPKHLVAAPSVGLGDNVVVGLIATDRFRDDGVPLGVPAPFPAARMPPLPLVPAGGAGPDVTVGRDQALALQPGAYGTLGIDGVLALNPGIYRVDKVRVGDGGRIVAITGEVHLVVAGTFSVGRHAAIYPDFDLPARQFQVSVAGYDSNDGPAASIGEHSRVRALLAAPHGSLSLADHVRATGAFAAFDIAAGEDVRVRFEDGFPAGGPNQNGSQQLSGYLNAPILNAPVVGPVPASQVVSLAIGLPAQNPDAMKQAAHDVADPASPSFRKYLTPSQFAATYGAPQVDYQAVVNWAQTHGLTVTATYPNRLLVDVSGTAAQIEQALYIGLDQRLRPDGSTFYALDRDPSIDLAVTLLWISGLDNRVLAVPGAGSGFGGSYNSANLHAAYASCTSATGAGQTVGLLELDGYTAADISAYECQLGGAKCSSGVVTSTVPTVTPVPPAGQAALPPTTVGGSREVTIDIDMAIGTAPGLAQVWVFEAPNNGSAATTDNILAQMAATQPLANQLSSSWFTGTDANTQPAIYALVLQGQTFLEAGGDQGSNSWASDPGDIRDLDGVTVVGGTALTMNGSPPAYVSETVWNIAGQGASGGGIATGAPIPSFQTGINMSTNGGSTVNRNLPDVSAVATNLGIIFTNPATGVQAPNFVIGTSVAAPIWAGLIALANQQSAPSPTGSGRVGDPNPFLYTIVAANAAAYAASFNTFNSGNNSGACPGQTGPSSAVCNIQTGTSPTGQPIFQNLWTPGNGNYPVVKGYNLATGLGSPKCALLNELANGALTATATSTATITYHQTGACNGYATSSGITSAGVNQAYVAFGIEELDNSGGTAPFAFDPDKLYVQQGVDNFFEPGPTSAIAGPFAVQSVNVPAEQVASYSVRPQAVVIVQTTNADGAQEASHTPYALKYKAAAADPTVLLTKSDASQTSWPYTPDCATLSGSLH